MSSDDRRLSAHAHAHAGDGAFHRPPRSFPAPAPAAEIVIARPPGLVRRGTGGVMQMLLPVLGSLGIVAFAVVMPNTLFLIVAGGFVAISLLSVLASHWAQRRSGKLSARTQRRLYRTHLAERAALLEGIAGRQRRVDERLYPDPRGVDEPAALGGSLWERRPTDRDFLSFRVGASAVPLACPVRLDLASDPLTEYQPEFLEQAQALVERWRAVDGLSVVASLDDASLVTLTGQRARLLDVARSLLAQAAVFRAPDDLRVMVSFAAADGAEWEWLKWLPHARAARRAEAGPAGGPPLLLAGSVEELGRLLEKHVQPRVEQLRRIESAAAPGVPAAVDAPELLLVLADFHAGGPRARLALMRELATRGPQLKVRTVCLVCDGAAEAPEASLRLIVPRSGGAVLERTGVGGHRIAPVALDELDLPGAEAMARAIAPLRLEQTATGIDLVTPVRLTDLLDEPVGGRLCAPIGLAEDGERLVLDLKQAAQGGMGPHGLVVGATGSGKSELLRTIVASLAASHRPDELSFVFVDFKGGAAFADLAGLPHSAGMITNLQNDLSLVDRMQAALFGEQQRRQSILRAAGNVDDIGAYRALSASDRRLEPLPHLLLIVDEFGELLANRPEFIDLFLAVGRVGRSLGMHLLLSSQRLEEGRLRGLEGHLRYRICLRTYSAQESKSVVTRQALNDCEHSESELSAARGHAAEAGQAAQSASMQAELAPHPAAQSEFTRQAAAAQRQQAAAQRAADVAESDLEAARRRGQQAFAAYEHAARAVNGRLVSGADELRSARVPTGGAPVPIAVTAGDAALARAMLGAVAGLPAGRAPANPADLRRLAGGPVSPGAALQFSRDLQAEQHLAGLAAGDDKPLDGSVSGTLGGLAGGLWNAAGGVVHGLSGGLVDLPGAESKSGSYGAGNLASWLPFNPASIARDGERIVEQEIVQTVGKELTASDLANRTSAELRRLASERGYAAHGLPDGAGNARKFRDPVTKQPRLRIDQGHVDPASGKPYENPGSRTARPRLRLLGKRNPRPEYR